MPNQSFRRYSPGDRPSSGEMNRLTEAVERFERMIPAGGLSLSSTGIGTQICDQRIPPFWAKITGVDGDKHSWQEVTQIEENVFEDVTEGRSGSADFAPAYEVNGGTVAEDTYVLLHAHRGGEYYLFEHASVEAGSLTVSGTPAGIVENVDYIAFDHTSGLGVQRGSIFITAATNDGQPIRITTLYPHRLAQGGNCVITGCTGNTAANGSWNVGEVINESTFTLGQEVDFGFGPPVGNGDYTGNGFVDTLGEADVLVFNEYAGFYQVGIIGTNTYEEEQYLGVGSKAIGGRLGFDPFPNLNAPTSNRVFIEAVNDTFLQSNDSYLYVSHRAGQGGVSDRVSPAPVRCSDVHFWSYSVADEVDAFGGSIGYIGSFTMYLGQPGIGAFVYIGDFAGGIINSAENPGDLIYPNAGPTQVAVLGSLYAQNRYYVGRIPLSGGDSGPSELSGVRMGIDAVIPLASITHLHVKGGIVVGYTSV